MSLPRTRTGERPQKGRKGHIPFLNAEEVRVLAARLRIPQSKVLIVLRIAGHVLRERYRKRGWLPEKRQTPPKGFKDQNPAGTGRINVDQVFSTISNAEGPVDSIPASDALRCSKCDELHSLSTPCLQYNDPADRYDA